MENHNFIDNASLKDGFSGDRRFLKGFLAKVDLVFALYPDRFQDDESKVIYTISRLYGSAMNYAASLIEKNDPCLHNYQQFKDKLKTFYGNVDFVFIANQMLKTLKQQHLGGIRGYILEFNRYADESNWNEQAKMDAFISDLNQQVAIRILEMFPGPRDLTALQTIASRIDSRLYSQRSYFNHSNNSTRTRYKNNSRKNIFKTKSFHGPLSKEEKERRKRENLCLYCGSASHTLETCPKKGKNNKTTHSFMAIPRKTFRERQSYLIQEQQARARAREIPDQPVVEFDLSCSYQTNILIDSGSKFNLIDVLSNWGFGLKITRSTQRA